MLTREPPTRRVQRLISVGTAGIMLCVGYAAWALPADGRATTQARQIDMSLNWNIASSDASGVTSDHWTTETTFKIAVILGQPFELTWPAVPDHAYAASCRVQSGSDSSTSPTDPTAEEGSASYELECKLTDGHRVIATPALQGPAGVPMVVVFKDSPADAPRLRLEVTFSMASAR
jgi:hypothetical protein